MLWCNILGDNEGSISDLLQVDAITEVSVLLTNDHVELKKENPDLILPVKRNEWRNFIDYFGLRIEAKPSRVGKRTCIFSHWIYNKPFICKAPYKKAQFVKIV